MTALLAVVLALQAAGAVFGLAGLREPVGRRLSLTATGLSGVAAAALSLAVLIGGRTLSLEVGTGLPFGDLRFRVDALSAFFLGTIGVVLVASAIYADGYLRHHERRTGPHLAVVAGLAASMTVVVVAADGWTFLLGWEAMAWLSYLAVILDARDQRAARAAFLMLAVSELGTVALVAAILALAGGADLSFARLAAGGSALDPRSASLVFLALIAGFGAKAGVLPLQLWLPEAHPAAPSHVSALLSAVIVKLGVYGIVRFALGFLPATVAWWGPFLMILGAVTAFVAVLWALFERDLKRVLAYSTIENVGIIVVAIGLAETFRQEGLLVLGSIALVVALYHTANHAFYKGLLFLQAGAVDHATGTRDLDRLGGLLRVLPWTGALFLVGTLSIAAIAPFGGYISEWMTLEALFQSFALVDLGSRVVAVLAGALLALTVATAVMVFARAFGIGFLGMARSRGAAEAREVPRAMRLGALVLLTASLVLGFVPALVLPLADAAAAGVAGPHVIDRIVPPVYTAHPGDYAPLVTLGAGLFRGLLPVNGLIVIPAPGLSTINSPTYLVLAELLLLALVWLVVRAIPRSGADRRAPVWAGGVRRFTAQMQYTAVAYANPMRLIFDGLLRSRTRSARRSPAAEGGTGEIEYEQEVPPPLDRELYRPLLRGAARLARSAKVIQSGDINQYVAYIFLVVIVVLLLRVLSRV